MKKMLGEATRGAMVIVVGNGLGFPSSNPGPGCFVSHSANLPGKNMHPTIFHPSMAD